MGRQQRELKARTGCLSTLTLPVILGDSGAQGVNSELGITRRMSQEGSECQ